MILGRGGHEALGSGKAWLEVGLGSKVGFRKVDKPARCRK
jgi:hypothetical protein